MGTLMNVREMLDHTYSLLVNEDGSLRPRSSEEMMTIARLLHELESNVSAAEDCLQFEALRALFEEHSRKSWRPCFAALAWATLLAVAILVRADQLPIPVLPGIAITWLFAGIVMHCIFSYYPNYLSGDSPGANIAGLRSEIVVGMIKAIFLPVIAVVDCFTKYRKPGVLD